MPLILYSIDLVPSANLLDQNGNPYPPTLFEFEQLLPTTSPPATAFPILVPPGAQLRYRMTLPFREYGITELKGPVGVRVISSGHCFSLPAAVQPHRGDLEWYQWGILLPPIEPPIPTAGPFGFLPAPSFASPGTLPSREIAALPRVENGARADEIGRLLALLPSREV